MFQLTGFSLACSSSPRGWLGLWCLQRTRRDLEEDKSVFCDIHPYPLLLRDCAKVRGTCMSASEAWKRPLVLTIDHVLGPHFCGSRIVELGRGSPGPAPSTSALLLQMPNSTQSSYVTLLACYAWSREIVVDGRDAHSLQRPASKSSLPADAVN